MQGAAAARPWVEAAGAAFPTVVDADNRLVDLYDAKVIPNGIFVAPDGTVRMRVIGGFDVAKPEWTAAVESLLTGEAEVIEATGRTPARTREPSEVERELVATKVRLGHALLALGKMAEAVAEWKWALYYDPDNFTVRKQIWIVEHPEKFHPTIDFAWQKEQLARERAEEEALRAAGCGPDGCPLPQNR